ncbi:MAG TPA: hypothetical protein VH054_12490 [Polyangiaceae bacterium]|jgi:hypothetical protein|nr:hypothetical protein [Polyangiaceae bacterium]
MNERRGRGHSTRMKTVLATFAMACALASTARADEAPLVDLDVQAPGFDVVALRARLAVSLAQNVSAPGLGAGIHLFVTEINGKIIVGLSQGTRQVTRQVELSSDHAVAVETLELLLVAMMRQEAAPPAAQNEAAPPAVVAPPPVVVAPPPPPQQPAPPLVTAEREYTMPFAIDLVPFVGFSTATRARDTRWLSIGAVGTVAREVAGLSVNGALGVTTGKLRGAQVSGAINVVAGDADGAQIAGAVNVSGDADGAQIAGAINVAANVDGTQIAGAINVAHGDVNGAQISGAINVASGRVHGLQLGVVNIADESDAPIGLVNVIKRGRHHVDVWGSESGLFMAGGQLGGKYTHAILAVGVRPGPDGARFAVGGGIGFHVEASERLGIDVDFLHYDLSTLQSSRSVQMSQARVLFDVELLGGVRVFAGPTFNVLESNDPTDTNPSPYGSWSATRPGSEWHVAIWPGIALGTRLL